MKVIITIFIIGLLQFVMPPVKVQAQLQTAQTCEHLKTAILDDGTGSSSDVGLRPMTLTELSAIIEASMNCNQASIAFLAVTDTVKTPILRLYLENPGSEPSLTDYTPFEYRKAVKTWRVKVRANRDSTKAFLAKAQVMLNQSKNAKASSVFGNLNRIYRWLEEYSPYPDTRTVLILKSDLKDNTGGEFQSPPDGTTVHLVLGAGDKGPFEDVPNTYIYEDMAGVIRILNAKIGG